MSEPCDLSAVAARKAIEDGRLTAEALTRSCLDRIAERDAEIHAWVALGADAALDRARALDAAPTRGQLHGLPLGVKDNVATRDLPTSYGSQIYAGSRPAFDAALVATARGAGAVPLGKTVTTEFAYYQPGPTRNPRDLSRTPGGSSSGSAAAVATGMVPLAIGTQTAGSIIRPASFCGVVGYKPTFGLVDITGVKPDARSLDTVGVLAREVADAALAVEALSGADLFRAAERAGTPSRIGLCRSPAWDAADDEMKAAFEDACSWLSGLGVAVGDVELPEPCGEAVEAHRRVMMFEFARALAFEAETHWERMSEHARAVVTEGLAIPRARYEADLDLGVQAAAVFADAARGFDAFVTPPACGVAPPFERGTGDPVFCRLWTLIGAPCVSAPGLVSRDGLPLGLQVVAPARRDAAALECAAWLQRGLAER